MILDVFISRSWDFEKTSFILKNWKFPQRTLSESLNAVFKFRLETAWQISDNIPFNVRKRLKKNNFSNGNIFLRSKFWKLRRQLWQKAERKLTEVRPLSLIVQGWKTESNFFRKIISSSNYSYRQVDCSFDNPPKTCRQVTDDSSLNVQKMKKKTNQTCSKQFFFSKPPFGHVESNFEKPVMKKWQENYIFRHKNRKWLKKIFFRKFLFSEESFGNIESSFDIYSETCLQEGRFPLARGPKVKKRQNFIRIKISSRTSFRHMDCSFDMLA